MDFGSISDTRTWVYWKYDLAILWEDFTTVDADAGTGCTAYFEIDKTDNGYELYRAFTDFELSDFGLPDEPLSFPLPDIDLKAAVNERLKMREFAITEPVLHYDGMGGLSYTGQDDGEVTVRFGLPDGYAKNIIGADNSSADIAGILYKGTGNFFLKMKAFDLFCNYWYNDIGKSKNDITMVKYRS